MPKCSRRSIIAIASRASSSAFASVSATGTVTDLEALAVAYWLNRVARQLGPLSVFPQREGWAEHEIRPVRWTFEHRRGYPVMCQGR